jgi:hypothetical protein
MKELFRQIKLKADSIPINTKENRRVKGAYVDCLMMIKEAMIHESKPTCDVSRSENPTEPNRMEANRKIGKKLKKNIFNP